MNSPPLEDAIDVLCRLLERDIVWCVCSGYQRVDTTWGDTRSQQTSLTCGAARGVTRLYLLTTSRVAQSQIFPSLTAQPPELQPCYCPEQRPRRQPIPSMSQHPWSTLRDLLRDQGHSTFPHAGRALAQL